MTFRAVLLGLIVGGVVAGVGYYNDSVLKLTQLVGNHFPVSVFGLLILFMLVVNPLLYLMVKRWRFRPAELGVVVALALVACNIPGSGMMRIWYQALAMPIHHNNISPGWKKYDVLQYVDGHLLAADKQLESPAVQQFLTESGRGLGDLPWDAWAEPLMSWLPLFVLVGLAVIALSVVVHRQWSSRERLRYPIADFATTVMSPEEGHAVSGVFRSKFFWVGLGVVLIIRVVNGINVWTEGGMITVPLQFDFVAIGNKFPEIYQGQYASFLIRPRLFPTVVAFSVFLASDVSLSLGLTQVIAVPLGAALIVQGVNLQTDWLAGGTLGWQLFGSFFGIALLLLYTGRRYYAAVLRQTFLLPSDERLEPSAIWGSRFFFLALFGIVVILWKVIGIPLVFSILTILLILLMFVVMARINAESGLFFIQPNWQPLGIFLGLFGGAALGPEALILIGLVCTMLTIDPREALMPFMINALKISDDTGVKPGKIGLGGGAMFLIAAGVAVPVVLWISYNSSVPRTDGWANKSVPKFTYDAAVREMDRLASANRLEESLSYSTWERFTHANPQPRFLYAAGVGVALVLIFSFLRLRYTWWPLHPILFLVWSTYPIASFSHSFLLGWLIKSAVTRFGGTGAYRNARGFMIGAIAGDLLGALLFMGVGAIYYAIVGITPPDYRFFAP